MDNVPASSFNNRAGSTVYISNQASYIDRALFVDEEIQE